MKEVLFCEKQRGLFPIMLAATVISAVAAVPVALSATHGNQESIDALWVLGIVFAVMLSATVIFRALEVRIESDALKFGFSIFSARIPIENITAVKVANAGFGRTLGLGIRIGFDGRIFFNTFWGQAVEVDTTGKRYAISIRDAKGFMSAVKTVRPDLA